VVAVFTPPPAGCTLRAFFQAGLGTGCIGSGMTLVLGFLFVAAAIAAVAFHLQLDALRKTEGDRRQAADEAAARAQRSSKELETAREELSRRKAEVAELREKLNDVRSRSHKQRESEKKQRAGAVTDLQDALDEARDFLSSERSRNEVLGRELTGMQEELARVKAGLARSEEAGRNLQAALARAQAQAQTALPAGVEVVPVAAPVRTDEQLKARAESLEAQARELRRKTAEAEEELRKARGGSANAKRQLLVTKSELDLFREKLVWSEKRVLELERLAFENKLALPEREPAPQPAAPQPAPGLVAREGANTGGEGVVAEGADYVPEAGESTEAASDVAAAVVEAVAPSAEVATETAAEPVAEAASEGPQAVPPIRRPKAAEGDEAAEG